MFRRPFRYSDNLLHIDAHFHYVRCKRITLCCLTVSASATAVGTAGAVGTVADIGSVGSSIHIGTTRCSGFLRRRFPGSFLPRSLEIFSWGAPRCCRTLWLHTNLKTSRNGPEDCHQACLGGSRGWSMLSIFIAVRMKPNERIA